MHQVLTVVGMCLQTPQAVGPLAATTEYDEPPGPPAPADASEADLAALQEKAWASASLAVAGIRVQGIKGRVPRYGSCSFRVEFTPKVPGKSASLHVQFSFWFLQSIPPRAELLSTMSERDLQKYKPVRLAGWPC